MVAVKHTVLFLNMHHFNFVQQFDLLGQISADMYFQNSHLNDKRMIHPHTSYNLFRL